MSNQFDLALGLLRMYGLYKVQYRWREQLKISFPKFHSTKKTDILLGRLIK